MPQKPNNTDPRKPKIIRINLSWLYIILLVAIGYMLFSQSGPAPQKIEWAQVVHYLRATRVPHALLINFGRPTLQYDTFDLDRLPSGASPDTPAHCGEAAATNIPLQVGSGSMVRSAGEAVAEPL